MKGNGYYFKLINDEGYFSSGTRLLLLLWLRLSAPL